MKKHHITTKRLSFTITVSLLLGMLLAAAPSAQAGPLVLLEDDFDDNSLDATKWVVRTDGFNKPPTSATEQNQQMEIEGRAHLNTVSQFDPSDAAVGGLSITGRWEFVTGDDMMQILTRTDGTPAGTYGETANGIEFRAYGGNQQVEILAKGGASISGQSGNGAMPGNINAGDIFDFAITDDGSNLSFTLTRVSNPAQFITVTASSSYSPASNLITFHNRESGRRSNLKHVVIASATLYSNRPTLMYIE